MLNMRDKEEGQKIIDGLHMFQLKGRELTVKWKEEGMWTCRDPSCRKRNFEEREKCIKCTLKKKVENTKDESKCERSGKVSLPEVFDPELGKYVAVDKVYDEAKDPDNELQETDVKVVESEEEDEELEKEALEELPDELKNGKHK